MNELTSIASSSRSLDAALSPERRNSTNARLNASAAPGSSA